MEANNKRERILHSALQLFQEHGIEATSVNDIVKKANVAKGTFYVYYKDKEELISLILTKKHGSLMNELINRSYEHSQLFHKPWMVCLVEEAIAFYETHPDVLRMIQKNYSSVMDTIEHRSHVLQEIERLDELLDSIQREKETRKQTLNRFFMMMETTGFICFHAIFYEQPDSLVHMKPLLIETITLMCR